MAKSADADDLKQLGSDAGEVIGPMKKLVEDATKTALLLVKSPNPKMAEQLATQVGKIMDSLGDLKNLQKELKAAT